MLKYQQNLEVEKYPPEQHASGGPIDSSLAERKTDVRRRFKVELFCQSMWKIEVGSAQWADYHHFGLLQLPFFPLRSSRNPSASKKTIPSWAKVLLAGRKGRATWTNNGRVFHQWTGFKVFYDGIASSPKEFTAFVLNYNLDVSAFVLVTVSTFPVWSSSIDCIPFLSTFLTTGHDPFFCSRILEFFLVSCFCLVVLRVICWRILFGVYAGVSYLLFLCPNPRISSETCCSGACGALVEMTQEKMTATSNPWMMTRHSCDGEGLTIFSASRVCLPCLECCVRLAGLCVFETFAAGRAETKNIQILCAIPATVGFSGGVVFLPVSQKWTSTHEKWLRVFQKVGQKNAPSTHFMTFKGSNAVRLVLGFVKLFTPPKFNSSPLKNATFLLGSR